MAILQPARILERAAAVLSELQRSSTWTPSLDRGTVEPSALLVRILTSVGQERGRERPALRDYYIVSIRRGAGVSARFALDAETGDFLEAEGVRKPGDVLAPYADPSDIVRRMTAPSTDELPSPEFVWWPCRQSTSRFVPFWRYQVQGRTVYVRADGVSFDELTVTGRG